MFVLEEEKWLIFYYFDKFMSSVRCRLRDAVN